MSNLKHKELKTGGDTGTDTNKDTGLEVPEKTGDAGKAQASNTIPVQYAMHTKAFPIVGMTIKEAFPSLKKLLNIDGTAVPVINGEEVPMSYKLHAGVDVLHFVKRSSIKGAKTKRPTKQSLPPEGKKLFNANTKAQLVKKILELKGAEAPPDGSIVRIDQAGSVRTQITGTDYMAPASDVFDDVIGFDEKPMCDFIRWHVRRGDRQVFIIELPPAPRSLNWAREGCGNDASYQKTPLATPYVVMKVVVQQGKITNNLITDNLGSTIGFSSELFYRREPLRGVSDVLFWPNLLNVSPNSYGVRAWICTQYLHHEKHDGSVMGQLDALQNHVWGAGFNRSSEEHEGASGFSWYEKHGTDPRTKDVDAWKEATLENWNYIREVEWLPCASFAKSKYGEHLTVRELIDRSFADSASGKVVYTRIRKKIHSLALSAQ